MSISSKTTSSLCITPFHAADSRQPEPAFRPAESRTSAESSQSRQCQVVAVDDFRKRDVAQSQGNLIGAAALDAADFVRRIVGKAPRDVRAVLRSQTDQLKNEVAKTEERLAKIKHDVGITSLEDARKSFADRLTRITQDLYSSEMQFFEGQALANEFSKLLPASAQTNAPAGGPIPPEAVREYKDILARMDRASKEKQELETRFTSEAPLVKEAVAKIDAAEKLKQKLEQENPQLTRVDVSAPNPGEKMPDLFMESVRLTVLKAKINRLKAELTGVQEEVAKVEKVEGEITQLHRKRDVDDAQYRYYLTSLDASLVQDSLGAGKVWGQPPNEPS